MMFPGRVVSRCSWANVRSFLQKRRNIEILRTAENKRKHSSFPFPSNLSNELHGHPLRLAGVSSSVRWFSNDGLSVPETARVVICGGGVIGTSVAYHLAERGVTDVVLLEQGRLTCGTTWHSVGLIGRVRGSASHIKLFDYSKHLYKKFEEEGNGVGWKECGSVSIARTKERMIDYRRKQALCKTIGVECHMVSPSELRDIVPIIRHDDLEGGLYIPGDGVTTAPDVAMTFGRLAKTKGVQILEGVQVKNILTKNKRVYGVETNQGTIKCEFFVNCGGQWARQLGENSTPEVTIPLHSCEHHCIVTKPIPGVKSMLPVVRDLDGYVCFREWNGGIFGGGFEPVAKPIFTDKVPDDFQFQLLPEDLDHFKVLMDELLHRVPCLESAEIKQMINGPESFTPDGSWILGEVPQIKSYFVAAGMNSVGIGAAGGIGKYVTEWILDGQSSIDLWSDDVRRFMDLHGNKCFLKDRVTETLGAVFTLKYPHQFQYSSARGVSVSPIHTRLEAAGAYFEETMTYERPLWFARKGEECDPTAHKPTFRKPSWFDTVREEYWACKTGVGLVDMSSITKFYIKSAGTEALDYLQYLCSNDIDQSIGTIVHTGMQNKRGGFENDCCIARITENGFLMVCPPQQRARATERLTRHLPADGSVYLEDVTSLGAGIQLVGPNAKAVLEKVTENFIWTDGFKPMTCKLLDVGYVRGVYTWRWTDCGEDGFTLFVPPDLSLHVFDKLMETGSDLGMKNVGHHAMRHLRAENFCGQWGDDLDAYTSPFECGGEVSLNKGDFLGRDALVEQKENGITKKFVQFLLDDFDVNSDLWPWGGEPVYRNGVFAGQTTTCGFGFILDRMVCLGFVSDFDEDGNARLKEDITSFVVDKDAVYNIDIAGKRVLAKIVA